ncbi:hypothetical protein AB0D74_49105 [Streptomyces sp. NPDC048278]
MTYEPHPDRIPPAPSEPEPPTAAAAFATLVDEWVRWAEEYGARLEGPGS